MGTRTPELLHVPRHVCRKVSYCSLQTAAMQWVLLEPTCCSPSHATGYSQHVPNWREWCASARFPLGGLSSETDNFKADVHHPDFTDKEMKT